MSERYAFIDNLKALGIVLVVLGHAPGIPAPVHTLIFGMHVPLFFFASGFLAGGDGRRGRGGDISALLGRFVLPYAAFFALSYLYWLPTHAFGNAAGRYADLAWWDPFLGFALGHGSYVNPTLWFFPCIATVSLLYLVALRRMRGLAPFALCAGVAAAVTMLWQAPGPLLPWRIDTALVALAFHAFGRYCRERELFGLAARPPASLVPWALALGTAYVALALRNPGVDLAQMRFGALPALYLPVACLGIAAAVLAGLCFAGTPATRWLAANTLYIFPLHWLMFRVFTGAGIVLFALPRDFKNQSWLIGVAYTALALLLCVPVSAVLRRLPGFVPGKPATDAPAVPAGPAAPPLTALPASTMEKT